MNAADPSAYEKKVVKLVNEERAKKDLEPLKMHDGLSELARKKSRDMAENDYFSHTSPTYGSPFDMMQQFDFTFRLAGENIAAGQRSPEQVVEGWMNSKGHRENILKEGFTHIGVGYVEGAGQPYGTYWTQLFMTPR
ncbi:CAP domain-containing protein [Lentibacillus kapialis]|uniref:CAP domain-containing protein n=1 Tax=Lentibacillus kapialis TaxID=340214 RepID=UPI003570BC34